MPQIQKRLDINNQEIQSKIIPVKDQSGSGYPSPGPDPSTTMTGSLSPYGNPAPMRSLPPDEYISDYYANKYYPYNDFRINRGWLRNYSIVRNTANQALSEG